MSNQYLDRLQAPANSAIQEMGSQYVGSSFGGIAAAIGGYSRRKVDTSKPWTAALDKQYGTNLMAQEGIGRTTADSILNNLSNQYVGAVRDNSPVVIKNGNNKQEAIRGLLSQAKGEQKMQVQQAQGQTQERARLRPRRGSVSRHKVGE